MHVNRLCIYLVELVVVALFIGRLELHCRMPCGFSRTTSRCSLSLV